MLSAIVLFATAASGCSTKTSGECNICPSMTNVNLAACQSEGAKAGCAKAEIREVTDPSCSVGKPAITHQVCTYTDCDQKLDCSQVNGSK
jgi:hypothetical protein